MIYYISIKDGTIYSGEMARNDRVATQDEIDAWFGTPQEQQYHASRADITSQYEPLLLAGQETRTVLSMRAIRNDTKLNMVGSNYSETLADMKAAFDQIDQQTQTPIEDTGTEPPFQANCHYCATQMQLKKVWGKDTWICPVCGRRVAMADALDTYLPVDIASDFNAAVTHYLDVWVQERGYDSIETAKQAATSTEFLSDGRAANAAYDAVWKYVIDNNLEAQVVAGTLTIDQAIAQLPVLSWEVPPVGPCGCKGPLVAGTVTASQSLIVQANGMTFAVIRNDNPDIAAALAAQDPPIDPNTMASLVVKSTVSGSNYRLAGNVEATYSVNGAVTRGLGADVTTTSDSWHIIAPNIGRGDSMTLHTLTTMDRDNPERVYTIRVLADSTAPDTADICNLAVIL